MFSIPINQKLTEEQFYQFFNFCAEHKDLIYDLYFTCRMPPFVQDAMGDVFVSDQDAAAPIHTALHIQSTLGISVSATFNNIDVPPTQKNLDLFIKNFQQLYDAGVRSATIPHTHWVATGQIQKAFPELYIKNTILRNVAKASDVAKAAESGFNYVNLDRDLMRDRDELIKCRKAADKYGIRISLLANEGCLGGCPMMDEHFQFNNSRKGGAQYFNDPISRVSCPKWSVKDPATALKTANIPPWREDWVELLQYVDVFKMHGRESITQLFNTMSIVSNFKAEKEILFDEFQDYLADTNLTKAIGAWRQFIKNCKFDCWDCNKCDKLYAAKSSVKPHRFVEAITDELVDSVTYNNNINVPGLTSKRVQNLLYGLSTHVKSYLEVGSAMGSTVCAINPEIEIHCVDNWKQNIQPATGNAFLPVNTKHQFDKNTSHIEKKVYDMDMFEVPTSQIKDIEMFFYDGPHDEETTIKAIQYYKDTFADTSILIFDDANWDGVVSGANKGIELAELDIIFNKLILNDVEDAGMWWNGLYIVVVQK